MKRQRQLLVAYTFLACLGIQSDVNASRARIAFAVGRPETGFRTNRCRATLLADLELSSVQKDIPPVVDVRPHEQRATRPRTARRLNHVFRYLYRHDYENFGLHNHSSIENLTSLEFLVEYGGYTEEQVYEMNRTFPPLLGLHVRRHFIPKMRFLQETVCGLENSHTQPLSEQVRRVIPPQYFGARLERTVAPRHAFLVYQNLPHGRQLLDECRNGKTLWQDFLGACRRPKQFVALCNTWRQQHPMEGKNHTRITVKQIEAFDVLFQRGLMAAARDDMGQWNNTWPLQHINVTAGEMIGLLVQHGANPLERDVRGTSLLHWAAGAGNMDAIRQLLPYFSDGVFVEAGRDGATTLHWAAAGANARNFGIGGHVDVCRYLLDQVQGVDTKRLVNTVTRDGNSVLCWAAWSGTLDSVKLLIRNRADADVSNRNGCTVAHWAASGGNLEVCRYLAETVGVDFTTPNYGGNTPLTHAVAFGRAEVVEWLRNEICCDSDDVAAELAKDFVGWNEGDEKRKQVLDLFHDWYGHGEAEDSIEVEEEDVFDSYY